MVRIARPVFAAAPVFSLLGCASVHFYHPALVDGVVVSATTGEPVVDARVSFETRAGDPIPNTPSVSTAKDGSFQAGSRESRRLAGLELMETIESKNPVTLRIDADGYETMRLDVEGKKTFRVPIELLPVGETP